MLYLYDSYGEWIAIKKDQYLFNRNGKWIGWFPNSHGIDENIAVDLNRKYLATIYEEDRLLVNRYQFSLFPPMPVSRPFSLRYIPKPHEHKSRVMILGTEDVNKSDLEL